MAAACGCIERMLDISCLLQVQVLKTKQERHMRRSTQFRPSSKCPHRQHGGFSPILLCHTAPTSAATTILIFVLIPPPPHRGFSYHPGFLQISQLQEHLHSCPKKHSEARTQARGNENL